MIRISQLKLPIKHKEEDLLKALQKKAGGQKPRSWQLVRRSIDARKKPDLFWVYTIDASFADEKKLVRAKKSPWSRSPQDHYSFPVFAGQEKVEDRPVIIGLGPAGLFAGLMLARAGLKPLIFERGECVEDRTVRVDGFFAGDSLDPESNVQFGEGGAGTFSDGKLNTVVKDKTGRNRFVLETFVRHGAPEEILYDARPHVGTDILKDVVASMRKEILALGGQVHFRTRVKEILFEENLAGDRRVRGLILEKRQGLRAAYTGNDDSDGTLAAVKGFCKNDRPNESMAVRSGGSRDSRLVGSMDGRSVGSMDGRSGGSTGSRSDGSMAVRSGGSTDGRSVGSIDGRSAESMDSRTEVWIEELACRHVILATGHSARDTFAMLHEKKILMTPKAFAIGVRVEHPASMINESQYGKGHDPGLPTASYKLTHQCKNGRGIYSFCMCPGGYVVNSSSEKGRLCVNGMSYHGRDGLNSNSAIITTVTPEDFPEAGPLGGVAFQRIYEEKAYEAAAGKIPIQLLEDFLRDRPSVSLGDIKPCIKGDYGLANLRPVLPGFICQSLKEGMEAFARRIHGFDRPDTLLDGVETRTSSPLRIERGRTLEASAAGLYPCGEGAGYAGGITSAAMDGIRVAEAVAAKILGTDQSRD